MAKSRKVTKPFKVQIKHKSNSSDSFGAPEEGKQGLDYIKILARDSYVFDSNPWTGAYALTGKGSEIHGLVIQMPMANGTDVLHVRMTDDGKVRVQTRRKVFDGDWETHAKIDVAEQLTLKKLGGD